MPPRRFSSHDIAHRSTSYYTVFSSNHTCFIVPILRSIQPWALTKKVRIFSVLFSDSVHPVFIVNPETVLRRAKSKLHETFNHDEAATLYRAFDTHLNNIQRLNQATLSRHILLANILSIPPHEGKAIGSVIHPSEDSTEFIFLDFCLSQDAHLLVALILRLIEDEDPFREECQIV